MPEAGAQAADDIRRRNKRRIKRVRAQGVLQGVISMLRPGDIVFDCGANVGDVTAQLIGSGAHIHAFEPDPVAFARLSDRFLGAANVTLHNVAVATRDGDATLIRASDFADDPTARTSRSTIVAGGHLMADHGETTAPVKTIDLPRLIRETVSQHGEIALLKLDIEGAELEILEALEQQDLFDAVRLTIVETHQGKFPALRPRFKALRKRIAQGYPATKVNLEWT
jgi:FkbM family methyltransferase